MKDNERSIVPVEYSLQRRAVRGPRLPRVAAAIPELEQFPSELLELPDQDRLAQVIAELHYFEGLAAKLRVAANQPPKLPTSQYIESGKVERYKGLPIRQLTTEPSVSSDTGWTVALAPRSDDVKYEPISEHKHLLFAKSAFGRAWLDDPDFWPSMQLNYKQTSNNVMSSSKTKISANIAGKLPVLCVHNEKKIIGVYRFQDFDNQNQSWVPQVLKFELDTDGRYGRHYIEFGLNDKRNTFLYRHMEAVENKTE